jgi:hypothetical protein
MKKFIAAVAALSLVATPAFADHRGDRRHHERNDRSGVSTGEAVAIGVIGMVLGGIITRSNEERYRNPPQVVVVTPQPTYEVRGPPRVVTRPQPQPVEVCVQAHYLLDHYGNIVRDQYGYDVVIPQRCWYQYQY